jgi:hypothetical protein
MSKRAMNNRSYRESIPASDSTQETEPNYLVSVPPEQAEEYSSSEDSEIDDVDASVRFVQDHLESEIGKQLEEVFGEFTASGDEQDDSDLSSEATAQRVFSLSKVLFELWRGQNPDMSEEELIDSFEGAIQNAVDQGYARAVDIFSSVEIDSSVLETAVETVSILHRLFSDYCADLFAQLDEREE